jgi:predicted amidohydrolase YtcJ
LLILDAEIELADGERKRADVRITGSRIAQIGHDLAARTPGARLDARGGALLPALHDHHIHLLALAAAMQSVDCGPPAVRSRAELAQALQQASGDWVRGVGYHESVAGDLRREVLDPLAPGRRVRIQHRSGAAWLLNTPALEALGITAEARDLPEGVERDPAGRPTGRLFRLDEWLRARMPTQPAPGLAAASRVLAEAGVASVTDATATNNGETLALLAREYESGALRQRVVVMGGPELGALAQSTPERTAISCGAEKLVLDERALPSPEALTTRIEAAHRTGRSVAIHCVTRTELVLAAHALEAAGAEPADRIEHASIAPPEIVAWLARLGVCVVTQPGFLFERGDHYLRDVEAAERPWLYRCRGFDQAAVPLGAGTDAPYSEPDPWRAMQAAVDRRTALGSALGADESVSPERALALFTTPHDAPGGRPRRVVEGAPADLVLLDRPWREARDRLTREAVAATFGEGRTLWSRGPDPGGSA